MRHEIFRMERVTYQENNVFLLEDINFNIFAGEIMGLIPVNRLGLAALLQLFTFNLPLHDGYIYYHEERINSWRGSNHNENRISIIQDKSCLVEGMTVADNIFVLRQGFRQRMIQPSLLRRQLLPFLEDIGVSISADTYVEKLTVFERVIVELLKAVVTGHKLIVLNEIGTIINDVELIKLHEIMKHYVKQGFSFLYVSLHYEEVLQICNRAAVMSEGHIEKIFQEQEMHINTMMEFCTEFSSMIQRHMAEKNSGDPQTTPVLELRNVCLGTLKNFSIQAAAGECIVVQNLNESDFKELLAVFMGDGEIESGETLIDGEAVVSIQKDRRIAVIQELPTTSMLFSEMSYVDNLCFTLDKRLPGVWTTSRIRDSIRREYGMLLGDEIFDLQVDDLDERQKIQLVYNRIMLQRPKVVFCIQPFKGADLAHRMFIWEKMEGFLKKDIAVVILANNLSDTLSLADRLYRIDDNNTITEYEPKDFEKIPVIAPWQHLYREKEES